MKRHDRCASTTAAIRACRIAGQKRVRHLSPNPTPARAVEEVPGLQAWRPPAVELPPAELVSTLRAVLSEIEVPDPRLGVGISSLNPTVAPTFSAATSTSSSKSRPATLMLEGLVPSPRPGQKLGLRKGVAPVPGQQFCMLWSRLCWMHACRAASSSSLAAASFFICYAAAATASTSCAVTLS